MGTIKAKYYENAVSLRNYSLRNFLLLRISTTDKRQSNVGYGFVCNELSGPCATNDLVRINLGNGTKTCLGPLNPAPTNYISAFEFINGILYGLDYDANHLYIVDTATLTLGLVGGVTPIGGHAWSGLAYDQTSGILYGMSAAPTCDAGTDFYTIDINNGNTVHINTTFALQCGIFLVIDGAGNAWAATLVTDEIYPMNMIFGVPSGAGVPITDGINPIDINFGQGASFDCGDDGLLYGSLFNEDLVQGEFGTLDPSTGVFSLLNTCPEWICAFSISCSDDLFEPPNIPGIPTLSQWGLFLFGLIFFTLGLVVVYNRKFVLQMLWEQLPRRASNCHLIKPDISMR